MADVDIVLLLVPSIDDVVERIGVLDSILEEVGDVLCVVMIEVVVGREAVGV